MSKYIIDTETWADLFEVQRVGVYGIGNDIVTDEKTVWSRMFRLDELEELNSDYINEHFGELQDTAYKKGLHDGESKCRYCNDYQRGLEDAWEAAKKLFSSMADSDIEKAFPIEWNNGGFKALMNLQPQEALAKLKAYEDKPSDRIEVGDIVDRYIDGKFDSRGIYLGGNGEIWDCLFWANTLPITLAYPKEQFKKTGKHYDIQSILEAMRE